MIQDFVRGASCLVHGYALVVKPGLQRFFVLPLLINVVVLAALILGGGQWFASILDAILPNASPWWGEVVRVILWVLFVVAALLLLFFSFTAIANLIGAPFNGLLAQAVERMLGGASKAEETPREPLWRLALASIRSELGKLRYFFVLIAIVFVLTLIPIINVIAPFLWVGMTAWMLALEYIAYPTENHGLDFKQTRRRLRQRPLLALGFGAAVLIAMLLPVVNFIVMPAAVAGATVLWMRYGT